VGNRGWVREIRGRIDCIPCLYSGIGKWVFPHRSKPNGSCGLQREIAARLLQARCRGLTLSTRRAGAPPRILCRCRPHRSDRRSSIGAWAIAVLAAGDGACRGCSRCKSPPPEPPLAPHDAAVKGLDASLRLCHMAPRHSGRSPSTAPPNALLLTAESR
jgi:hypothetical protein